MHAFVWLSVEPGTLWKGRRDGGENWECGWRSLDQGGLHVQGGRGGNAREAEGSTKSE